MMLAILFEKKFVILKNLINDLEAKRKFHATYLPKSPLVIIFLFFNIISRWDIMIRLRLE